MLLTALIDYAFRHGVFRHSHYFIIAVFAAYARYVVADAIFAIAAAAYAASAGPIPSRSISSPISSPPSHITIDYRLSLRPSDTRFHDAAAVDAAAAADDAAAFRRWLMLLRQR